MEPWFIEHRQEFQLEARVREQLQELLALCFPGFLDRRIYYKQLPQGRLLAWQGQRLVGQLGYEHRVIRVGEQPCPVLGLIDICVAPALRKRGVGSALLEAATQLAHEAPASIDGLLLFADRHEWYKRHGFQLFQRSCTWLAIDEHRTLDVFRRQVDDIIMIKSIDRSAWPEGEIDLLGYMF